MNVHIDKKVSKSVGIIDKRKKMLKVNGYDEMQIASNTSFVFNEAIDTIKANDDNEYEIRMHYSGSIVAVKKD